MIYEVRTPKNYPTDGNCLEVVWKVFMPFDVIRGLDSCPPDNKDYDNVKKTSWWVCPRTESATVGHHDISVFIPGIPTEEFKKLEDAISFCVEWREKWLRSELSKIIVTD
jgi:hypothetical protein